MEKNLTIGEAAKAVHMTAETLRHYDRIGLVQPSVKDPWTRYRYYSPQDLIRLHTVRALQQMDLPLEKIKEVLEKGAPGLPCEIRENDSGLHFLLHLKTDLTDREVVKKLAEQGVRVHALSEYYTKKQGEEHFFIINYSNLDVEKAAAAMEIIADVTGGKL